MSLAGLDAGLRPAAQWCLDVAAFYGVPVQVTSVYRSWTAQRELRDRYERCVERGQVGMTRECRWPANRPGDSAHNYGLAWDSVVPEWAQEWWNAVREVAGFYIPPNDPPHAALPNWRDFAGSLSA